MDEVELRQAFAGAAKQKGWFKRIDLGEELAEILLPVMSEIADTDLARKLIDIERWLYS